MELLPSWYAVYTTSRSEKKVKAQLRRSKSGQLFTASHRISHVERPEEKSIFPFNPRLYFRPYPDSGHLKSFKYTRNCHLSQRKSGPRPHPG